MRARAALVLAPALLLAGCGDAPVANQTIAEQEAARAAELSRMRGWQRMFAGPQQTVAIANQFGFRNAPYAEDVGGFASTGDAPMVVNSSAPQPNSVSFAARGASADRIDSIVITLSITDPQNADLAKQRLQEILTQFLFQFELQTPPALAAFIGDERPATVQLPGVVAEARASDPVLDPMRPSTRTLTVTFTRTGASAPANR